MYLHSYRESEAKTNQLISDNEKETENYIQHDEVIRQGLLKKWLYQLAIAV